MFSSRSMQPTTRSLKPPLGGSNGSWRYRLLRFHVPLALTSVVVIFLWMSLPLFQAAGHQAPPQTDSQTSDHQGSSQMSGHQGASQAADAPPSPTQHSGNQAANLDGMQNRAFMARFTTASGYVALGFLALTLRRRTPITSYLTRDVGTWATIVSVIHVIAGFFVHGPPAPLGERILSYFFAPDGSPLTNSFGLANWTGIAATVIVVGLLAISNDFALRKLKAGPWKTLQRLNYVLFVLVILHAIYYGALLRVTSPSTILLSLSVSAVFIGQMVGIWLWRRRHARRIRERQSVGGAP